MKALFCHDHIYKRTDERTIVSEGQYHGEIWNRYLEHFSSLTVLGRDGGTIPAHPDLNIAGRDRVNFCLFADKNSFKGLLSGRKPLKTAIKGLVAVHDCIILRGISEIGLLAYKEARRQNKAIALEMVACPWDSLWYYGSIKAKLYSPFRYLVGRHIARHADGVIYVSNQFLQKRYPSKATIQENASNVEIKRPPQRILRERIQKINGHHWNRKYKIGLIGSLSNGLKGIDTAIEACAMMHHNGFEMFKLHILGPGNPDKYKALIDRYDLKKYVAFDGIRQSGDDVLHWLDTMDLYIQPSLQEGLPRAVIEAMSRGLPVIGSNAGGIPELIDCDQVIAKKSPRDLANAITRMVNDKEAMKKHAKANFATALNYTKNVLEPRRFDFWQKISLLVGRYRQG